MASVNEPETSAYEAMMVAVAHGAMTDRRPRPGISSKNEFRWPTAPWPDVMWS
jgi:hypothetical protein